MMDARPVIEMRGVRFAYDGEPALFDVNLRIDDREFVTIVGVNGGGKTTLLKLILGLLTPHAGTVRIFGEPPERARGRVGYLSQHLQFDPQFPIAVREVVLAGRLGDHPWLGRYSREDRTLADRALAEVGLTEFAARPFASLSGGQRQRALIARTLTGNPELLLLDEPTANLDLASEQNLYALLHKLSERMAVVMVSHDLNFVTSYAGKVVCVNRTVAVHPTGEVPASMVRDFMGGQKRLILHDRVRENGSTS